MSRGLATAGLLAAMTAGAASAAPAPGNSRWERPARPVPERPEAPGATGQGTPASAARDTARVDPAPEPVAAAADTARAAREPRVAAKRPARFETPRWVMLRSAVVPGWGQAHNGSWIKAAAVAAGEVGIVWKLFDDHNALDALEREIRAAQERADDDLEAVLVDRYNTRLDAFTGRQWLLGAVVLYSLLDAYIDAHFRSFKTEFQTDPALPEGVPPASGMRFGLRVSF